MARNSPCLVARHHQGHPLQLRPKMSTPTQKFPAHLRGWVRLSTGIALCSPPVLFIAFGRAVEAGIISACLVLGILFAVRNYRIGDETLSVHGVRLLAEIPLDSIEDVHIDPEAMRGSSRYFSTGLFGFTGRQHNDKLGWYRVYATNSANAVVVRSSSGPFVVTPDDPRAFVQALTDALDPLKKVARPNPTDPGDSKPDHP